MMKEVCIEGHTESMGKQVDVPRKCAAWQPVATFIKNNPVMQDIYACSIFEWSADLQTETASEVYKVGAEIASFRKIVFQALPAPLQKRMMEGTAQKQVIDLKKKEIENNGTKPT